MHAVIPFLVFNFECKPVNLVSANDSLYYSAVGRTVHMGTQSSVEV